MLRRAELQEAGYVQHLWTLPAHENFIDPPAPGQVAESIADGMALVWEIAGKPVGFACLTVWHPGVYGLSALVVTQPGVGGGFFVEVLAEVFGPLAAHRLGLDVTTDNARALRFFEAAGFQREGVLRECWQRPAGDWVDCVFLAMLAREWRG